MVFLYLFMLLFAAAYGDLLCAKEKFIACALTLLNRNVRFCLFPARARPCLQAAARDCGVEHFIKGVKYVKTVVSEICTSGTELNTGFKNSICAFNLLPELVTSCSQEAEDSIRKVDVSIYLKENKRNTFNCKYNEQIQKCQDDLIIERCGEKARKFNHIYGPGNRLGDQACLEYIAPAANAGFTFSLVQAFIPFLSLIWSNVCCWKLGV